MIFLSTVVSHAFQKVSAFEYQYLLSYLPICAAIGNSPGMPVAN
jgi:hypothetical protein